MASKQEPGSDSRFSRTTRDPRFWEMPEKERKIKIDKRFKSMFHDKKFNLKYTVDKRGRPMNHSTREDLKRFYDLSDSDELSEEEEETPAGEPLESDARGKGQKSQKAGNKAQATEKSKKNEANKKVKEEGVSVHGGTAKEKDELVKVKQKSVTLLSSTDSKKSGKQGTKTVPKEETEEDEADVSQDDDIDSSEASEGELDEVSGSEGESDEEESEDVALAESEEDDDNEGASSAEENEEDSDGGPDLARGKGNIETSSEDDDDDDDEEDDSLTNQDPQIEHAWRELDKDALRGDQVTSRLAVCNMDWDRLKAKDLLALFNSFKPKGGIVFSVKIYPSEFGKEKLKEEDLHGPSELKNVSEDNMEEHESFKEKLRDYQFKRLKYFYAVVECDSPDTANKIYEECDGLEFESSCSFVDLRFIPDDVQFKDEPKDSAVDVDLSAYKPKFFTSAALSTSKKVELTWDETDHERITTLNRPFKKTEILDMDFQAYLASSSEEEEDEEESVQDIAQDEDITKSKKSFKEDEDQIARYRELLKSVQEKDKKRDNDMEMEVKWVPGLKENAEKMVKNKLEGKDKLTPWEKYLQKQKDKRKLKKRKKGNTQESEEEEEEEIPSDVDFDDPYFSEELRKPGLKNKSATGEKEREHSSSEGEAEKEKQRAEMALLMMDDVEEDRDHFNYDKIVEHQNLSKKKKKKLQKKQELVEDDFQINVEDTRFQALYTSHLYNVDPSDPNFKKTKANERVLEEKARRREKPEASYTGAVKRQETESEDAEKKGATGAKTTDPALAMLLKSVKNKTQQFQASKRQKTK